MDKSERGLNGPREERAVLISEIKKDSPGASAYHVISHGHADVYSPLHWFGVIRGTEQRSSYHHSFWVRLLIMHIIHIYCIYFLYLS